MIIDDKGIQYDSYTDDTQLAICSMEYIYFARPDSNIHGVNVHTARKRMGAQLAREFKHEADIVSVCPILPQRGYGICGRIWFTKRNGSYQEPIHLNVPLSNRLKNCGSKVR